MSNSDKQKQKGKLAEMVMSRGVRDDIQKQRKDLRSRDNDLLTHPSWRLGDSLEDIVVSGFHCLSVF